MGLNGAGKTTFIKLLLRLYDVTEGKILCNGTDIRRFKREEYYRIFAPVFQNVEIFAFPLSENVSMKRPQDTDRQLAEDCLRKGGLGEKLAALPKGADTQLLKILYEEGADLSGGEKQKLALARALYKNAPVMVLDEPTAALDALAEYNLYKRFDEIIGGKTAVYISHRLSSTRFCDHIAMFRAGEMVEYGTHEELLAQKGAYAEMFEIQAQYYKEGKDTDAEEMSRRGMELDFQLTEDKAALDQIEAARTGMDWYSGGVYGISMQLFNFVSNLLKIIGVVVLIALYAPVLFVLTAVILAADTLIHSRANRIEIEAFGRLSKLNRIFGYLGFTLTDFRYGKDIRLYDAKDMMVEKWEGYSQESLKNWKWKSDRELPLNILTTLFSVARDFGSYLYLGILVITGKITIGTFSQMLSAGSAFHSSLQGLIMNIQELIKRTSYAYEYVKFMHYPAAIRKGERHVSHMPHTLTFRDVSFAYPGTDIKVLSGVNVTLQPGEHLSVVGLNGAGKTTFVKLLCRLYDPTEGEILLDGVSIKEYDYREYMALFSPVFQDFKLLAFSITENITLDDSGREEDVRSLIRQVGLEDKVASLEKGTDTILFKAFDENGIEPSGGEQQKIAIARALFKKSPVVILDEPTAALDPVAEYEIYRQFHELVGGKTAIYISHRLSSCRFCDRIAVFSGGKILEYGTHEELAHIPGGIYAEMFAAQAQYYQ